jgi:tRNA A37 threonylcarbamoyladenosine dehydratase
MSNDWQTRTRLLIGDAGVTKLAKTHVLLAGVGGVGGHIAESLARAGIGKITLIDMDVVSESNRNRQLVALTSTVGLAKVSVMRERIKQINPACEVECIEQIICEDASDMLTKTHPDIVVDAIDSVSCKVALLIAAVHASLPVYSSMGAGRRIDVRKATVMDVMDTQGCGLARQVRGRLRKAGVGRGIVCVASSELPRPSGEPEAVMTGGTRVVNGTISYMPALFGLMLAGEVLRGLLEEVQK